MKTERIDIRISPEDKEQLKKEASQRGISMATYLLRIWKEKVNENE